MGKSKIEWTERTWNPVTGCTKVSQGCKHCYAERMYERFNGPGTFKNVTCHEDRLGIPFRIKKPSVFFVNSMSDLFHELVPFSFVDYVFAAMAICKQHTFQILTKRPERMLEYFKYKDTAWRNESMQGDERIRYQTYHRFGMQLSKSEWQWPLPNVWIGVSVEDQKAADERIPLLLQVPAAVRWLSCEPLLGEVSLFDRPGVTVEWLNFIHWVVVGGESGPHARPMNPAWAEKLRWECELMMVPFFFKQWGEWNERGERVGKSKAGRLLNSKLYDEYPEKK